MEGVDLVGVLLTTDGVVGELYLVANPEVGAGAGCITVVWCTTVTRLITVLLGA